MRPACRAERIAGRDRVDGNKSFAGCGSMEESDGGTMKIILSNQSEKPIYQQIKEQIEEQILSGEISENTVLPSIRKMAADLNVSVITTTRAYKELEGDGFITTVPGKGCIVLAPGNKMLREQYLRRMEEGFSQAAGAAKKLQMPLAEAQEIFETVWNS